MQVILEQVSKLKTNTPNVVNTIYYGNEISWIVNDYMYKMSQNNIIPHRYIQISHK